MKFLEILTVLILAAVLINKYWWLPEKGLLLIKADSRIMCKKGYTFLDHSNIRLQQLFLDFTISELLQMRSLFLVLIKKEALSISRLLIKRLHFELQHMPICKAERKQQNGFSNVLVWLTEKTSRDFVEGFSNMIKKIIT